MYGVQWMNIGKGVGVKDYVELSLKDFIMSGSLKGVVQQLLSY